MTKNRNGLLVALASFSSLLVVVLVGASTLLPTTEARDPDIGQQVRNALAELDLKSGENRASNLSKASNLSSFISYRAGVLLSDLDSRKLAGLETIASASQKRISRDELAQLLTGIAVRKLKSLSDDQKRSAIESMRGFDHPALPQSFKRGRDHVMLRANGSGRMTLEAVSEQIDKVRGANAESKIVESMIRNAIALEIGNVCSTIVEAEPGFFGGSKCEMTPLQAFLVTYAVVTDDLLAGNRADLSEKMSAIERLASAESGAAYPSFVGQKPYGNNGYIFSSPADLLLDQAAISELMEQLSQRIQ